MELEAKTTKEDEQEEVGLQYQIVWRSTISDGPLPFKYITPQIGELDEKNAKAFKPLKDSRVPILNLNVNEQEKDMFFDKETK